MTEAIVSNTPNPRIDANPDVVGLPGGRAALTWQAGRADGGFDIMLRLREADGTFGEATRLQAGSEARAPELARLSDDTVLVTWIAESGDGEGSLVRAQRFDGDGTPLSVPFEALSAAARLPWVEANAVPDPDGGFAVYATGQSNRSGNPVKTSASFEDNASVISGGDVANHRIGVGADTEFVVGEYGTELIRDGETIVRISFGDYWIGGRFEIDNIARPFRDMDKQFTLLEGGELLVSISNEFAFPVWENFIQYGRPHDPSRTGEGADYSPFHVFLLDLDEAAIAELPRPDWGSYDDVPSYTPEPIYVPEDRSRIVEMQSYDVAALADGGFVATWSDGQDVLAQRFDSRGAYVGDNYVVADGPSVQRGASVTQVDADTLLFAWLQRDDGDADIFTRAVALDDMSEGTYALQERPYLSLQGRLEGEGRAETVIRIEGGVETNYPLTDYDIRWERAEPGADASDWRVIEGENGLRLALDDEDVGSIIRLVASVEGTTGLADEITVEFGDYYGYSGPQAILPALLETARTVTLEGEPNAGETLTARPTLTEPEGPLDGPVFFQWLRDGEPIAGAFDPTYAVTPEDVGADLSVEIRYAETDGTEGVLRSDPVEATALPSVAGSAGDDLLEGSAEAEAISGGSGDDTLLAHGDDRLEGGPGDDVFAFAAGRIAGVAEVVDFGPGDRIALDDALLGAGGVDFDPRLADLPTLLGALGTGRLSWSPVDAGRAVWSLGLDPDGDGSDPLAEVARVTAANGNALALEVSDVLLF